MEVLICNSKENIELNKNYDKIFIWNEYFESTTKIISIPQIIEEQSDFYKKKILDLFFNISECKTKKNIKIIDALNYNNELSYWWLTSLGQKTNININSGINNVLKTIILNDLIKNLYLKSIDCQIDNIDFKKLIYQFCNENNIKSNIKNKVYFTNFKNIVTGLKFIAKNLFLTFFKFNTYKKEHNEKGEISFFDVFVHLKPDSIENNYFKSSYWNELVNFINSQKFKTNWVHIFYPHVVIPTYNNAKSLIKSFTCSGNHFLIEDYITYKTYYRCLLIYIKKFLLFRQAYSIILQNIKYEKFNISYLLKSELHESMFGITRFKNEILLQLYDSILSDLPKQKIGIYIQENQFWEYILLSKWRKYNHGKIFGVPHSTVRYWDLRYFHSDKILNNYKNFFNIFPDLMLVNSNYALKLLNNSGYPLDCLNVVEALRYQHLCKPVNNEYILKKILIFGDYRRHINLKILSLVSNYISKYPDNLIFYFKPHPAYDFNLTFTNIIIEKGEIENIWGKYSNYITSDITSTSAELYTLGY